MTQSRGTCAALGTAAAFFASKIDQMSLENFSNCDFTASLNRCNIYELMK